MSNILSKKQSVLRLDFVISRDFLTDDGYPGYANFVSTDENEYTNVGTHLTVGDYEAMGKPETITVTIEPGDHLNPQEKA